MPGTHRLPPRCRTLLTASALALATLSGVTGAAAPPPNSDVASRPFGERPDAVLPQRPAPKHAARRTSRTTTRRTLPRYVKPVDRYALSSGFGARWGRLHAGVDFAAPVGTPVRAVAAGEVVAAGWEGGYGQLLVIRHADGLVTAYAHLSAILVPLGARVGAGDPVARVGNTGHSTGPHLHLELRAGDAPHDPLPWLRQQGLAM